MKYKRPIKLFLFVCALGVLSALPKKAQACCVCSVEVATKSTELWFTPGTGTVEVFKNHLDAEFNAQEAWMVSILFEDHILPAMMLMTEQLTVVAMQQVMIFGTFLDAKHQLESQRLFKKLSARAHKDFHPSLGMCEFGSAIKSLAASERKSEVAALTLSQRSQDRQLGSTYTSAAYGNGMDKESRLRQFRTRYCDPRDQNKGLALLCTGSSTITSPVADPQDAQIFNKDIDFARTVDAPWTISADFTDSATSSDEIDVIALASYLYAHDVFTRIPAELLDLPGDNRVEDQMTPLQMAYLDMRSIVAKRSVAENSYNAIVGMKSSGTPGSRDFLVALLEELGITSTSDIDALLGNPALVDHGDANALNDLQITNPSYYAQMEILTKKIYQNPDFYTNLYDKPANVARKQAAMQAIGLMQKFDIFKSYLRSEASLSILLELAVMDLQEEIEVKAASSNR